MLLSAVSSEAHHWEPCWICSGERDLWLGETGYFFLEGGPAQGEVREILEGVNEATLVMGRRILWRVERKLAICWNISWNSTARLSYSLASFSSNTRLALGVRLGDVKEGRVKVLGEVTRSKDGYLRLLLSLTGERELTKVSLERVKHLLCRPLNDVPGVEDLKTVLSRSWWTASLRPLGPAAFRACLRMTQCSKGFSSQDSAEKGVKKQRCRTWDM